MAEGMDELMVQAQRTAEEVQAIDAVFQDRVRHNFEMLSEAVKFMGVAAAAPAAGAETGQFDAGIAARRRGTGGSPPARTSRRRPTLSPCRPRAVPMEPSWPIASACETASA